MGEPPQESREDMDKSLAAKGHAATDEQRAQTDGTLAAQAGSSEPLQAVVQPEAHPKGKTKQKPDHNWLSVSFRQACSRDGFRGKKSASGRHSGLLFGIFQECGQVLEGVDIVQLAGVNQAHEQVADGSAVPGLIKEAVLAVQYRCLESALYEVIV
jgi:hypothetical protein